MTVMMENTRKYGRKRRFFRAWTISVGLLLLLLWTRPHMDMQVNSIASINNPTNMMTTEHAAAFVRGTEAVCTGGLYGPVWMSLCKRGFVSHMMGMMNKVLQEKSEVLRILQIGAHTGWEANDPFAKGITALLESLPIELRQARIEYTMIEASPPNYSELEKNVKAHSSLCTFKTVHAGVVPDKEDKDLLFYAINETIDVHTGYDSNSGKQFPPWVTQISSFDKNIVMKESNQWKQFGLDIEDYIVETRVNVLNFSELLAQSKNTIFVLIDTEGLDCKIVESMRSDIGTELPPFLLYEHKHCNRRSANEHLKSLKYQIENLADDVVASYVQ